MFCSKCGKTIRLEDSVCPSCNAPIGDNRFGGMPYTSAQFTIAPGQKTFEALNNYTRTTYTSMNDAEQEGGEPDSRTTYRPVYEGASAPEDVRRDMRAAVNGPEPEEEAPAEEEPAAEEAPGFIPGVPLSPAAQATLDELDAELKPDEQIDREQFRSRPIKSAGRAGISQDVTDYIRKLEDGQARRGAGRRRAAAPVYDDFAAEAPEAADYGETDETFTDETFTDENYTGEDYAGDDYTDDPDYDPENPDTFDDFDNEDDDYEEGHRTIGAGMIIKIAVALVLVAAIVFFGIKWIGHIRGSHSSAPIEGVSETLYTEGIALIKSHVTSEYIDGMKNKYTNDGILAMTADADQATAAINALLPAEPAANDQTFISALQAIQKNIISSITMDAIAVGNASPTAMEDSNNRWTIVNNSILQLESATSAAELTAIINGQTITVQTQTPAPTAEPITYASLVKGDENNDVMKLQMRLYDLGFLTGDRDGVFGSKTQTAVKLFQETAGLNASGIADSETQALLYSDEAPYAPGAATPTPAPTSTPAPAPTEAPIQPAEAADAA